MKGSANRRRPVFAIASGGGHWVELQRLAPAFASPETVFISTLEANRAHVADYRYLVIPDASRLSLLSFLPLAWRALWLMLKERPRAIVTTGSAPVLAFVIIGRLMGVKMLWIDSLANPDLLSTSGRIARRFVDKFVVQWEDLARTNGHEYWGSVYDPNDFEGAK